MNLPIFEKVIGKRFTNLRKHLGIQRAAFARIVNIPKATLGNYERGDRTNVSAGTMLQIHNQLGLKGLQSISYLIFGSNSLVGVRQLAPVTKQMAMIDRLRWVSETCPQIETRQDMADILGLPKATLKGYELGYRKIPASLISGLKIRFGINIALWVLTNRWLDGEEIPRVKDIPNGYAMLNCDIVTDAYYQIHKFK